MALVKGVNSYATVAEADAYFADRLDVAAWTSTTPEQKAQALVTATSVLDDLQWTGTAISESQKLAFPRSGQYFDPRVGTKVWLSDTVPTRVINATFEQAYHLLNNDGLLDNTGTVRDLSITSIDLIGLRNPNVLSPSAKRQIKAILVNSGSSNWWRSN
jgi:hypothetical protein